MGGLIKVVVSTRQRQRQRQQPLVVTLCCLSILQLLVDWGTQATHPLPPCTVVNMLGDNGFQKSWWVGIPNDMLYNLANSEQAADTWVAKNVSSHIYSGGVDIR
ncbi:GLUCAN ENDO-13-BETA-GLUCOSIDASE BG1-RELATED-RELATED [Salix purpurea]|uniref:GLUCAN ENDO-13-BETA-GLUCOSIDASE BG1-RELATED-RELATED n=1 Tax=Salix purpurea TaxID=77065 RepID=A0A9Q0NZQ4_SALPP|nr:GLUCAN ENDO-13-BETA-GLUCOSIDASE BG1-RELATED-RELATED [Salix purpurea]